MKNKLSTLAAALTLAAVIGGVYAAPALAAVIKAALIKNIDEKGRSPYTEEIPCNGTGSCSTNGAIVPTGKRLVIEHASGTGIVGSGASVVDYDIQVSAGTPIRRASLTPKYKSTISSQDEYGVNEAVLIYVDAGSAPQLSFTSSTLAPVQARVTLSGYVIDLNN